MSVTNRQNPAMNWIKLNIYKTWMGNGYSSNGDMINWNMQYVSAYVEKPDTTKKEADKKAVTGSVMYPFIGYGWTEAPKQEDLLIKNATVWTNEHEGNLENTDLLIRKGKIVSVGKGLAAGNAKIIDGTGARTCARLDAHMDRRRTG